MLLNGGELAGERILSRKTLELMTANHLGAELLPYEIGGVYSCGYGCGLGFGVAMDDEVPMVTQERAYTSPIWYQPAPGR